MNTLSTKEKAVQINIVSNYHGTIAEIGGGQETARHLFQAGGASNTVAKSISAYDKLFSDHFYNEGRPSRYVTEDRLKRMVKYEYDELINILDNKSDQHFFAFANTVETINFSKSNQGNGWLGIAVQGTDRYRPNQLFIHVNLLEKDTLLQQYTLGTLGINLIYGGLFYWSDPEKILLSLLDNLDADRAEVDYVYAEGPDIQKVDNRLLNLMLVSNNMTPAIMFDKSGRVQHPGEMLYRKNVLLSRGYYRPINKLGMKLIEDSLGIFRRDEDYTPENTIAFCEISLYYLMHEEQLDEQDFLHRVDLLNLVGQNVMISRFPRFFELVNYFGQFKLIKLRIVVGLPTFLKILDPSNYNDLRGGLLEAIGALFQKNVKVYLYPAINTETGEIVYPDEHLFSPDILLLWKYLNLTGSILIIKSLSTNETAITSEYISRLVTCGNEKLSQYLPEPVLNHIREKQLFGYQSFTHRTESP